MTSNIKFEGPLFDLFYQSLPGYRSEEEGTRSINATRLAAVLNLKRQTIYSWFWTGRLPAHMVDRLIAVEGNAFKLQEMLPFVGIESKFECAQCQNN